MAHIFNVSELTASIREVVEMHFAFVWVRGQVTNLSRPGSGHIYFTLKDEQAGLQVVWFKNVHPASRKQGTDPAATLENGQDIICAGRIGVYPPRGTYQLIAELVQEQGLGDLFLAFEALKSRLQQEGLFEAERKMKIPFNPERVGIITAPTGAALQDFMRVAEDTGLGSKIIVYPSLVQGDKAPADIARAINRACREDRVQVLVLMRGGGSLEDLWAFNSEEVARAIAGSHIPVITGVGHEVDTTIADLAADLRAATPSHVPQHLWPRRKDLWVRLDEQEMLLMHAYKRFLKTREEQLHSLSRGLGWLSPVRQLQRRQEQLDSMEQALKREGRDLLDVNMRMVQDLESRLRGKFSQDYWEVRHQQLDYLQQTLKSRAVNFLDDRENKMFFVAEKLESLDPYAPIRRGYSLVTVDRSGKFLRSVKDVSPGDDLEITVIDGQIKSRVRED
ncbi:exodeoxyribonuclease VII large subunit [Desulfonatronospira sp.]|uniref:exodeoxyribonuclease VII large subunit n=1 Tax=Desulfonatronospira sp. TaxID=1962951 RepID=UPI0025C084A4|nr:exodeoxyribonuclease VII large subunit [Desulfonatronospira sp.]